MMQTATIQFQYYPECTVLQIGATPGSRSSRSGSTWWVQLTALVQRQGKCKVFL